MHTDRRTALNALTDRLNRANCAYGLTRNVSTVVGVIDEIRLHGYGYIRVCEDEHGAYYFAHAWDVGGDDYDTVAEVLDLFQI